MNWIKAIVVATVIYVALWIIFVFCYGQFVLADSVVPVQGVDIDEWLSSYYYAGAVSVFIAWIFSMIWFYMGTTYAGESGITMKHNALWFVVAVLSFVAMFFMLESSQDGSGGALWIGWLIAPIGFYINSLVNSAEAVKFIPPLAMKIHK